MPEKTGGSKRRSPAPHVFERFRKGMDDEPKHAAHFPEKATAFLANAGNDDDRIGLDLSAGFQLVFLVRHPDGKLPQFSVVQRKIPFR